MLIGLQNVTFEFGARVIVEDATWHIQPGDRVGLIGYNGTGKSTILKLLVGQYTPSKGSVEKGRETTIGYLHQDLLSFDTNESILEVAMGAFEKVKALEKEIEELGKRLETEYENEDLLLLYSERLHDLEVAGGYTVHHRTEEVLQGLGFANEHLQRPYKEFSGGWRMRVLLAKMILQQPDVLLLDEPTNHLDMHSVELLADALNKYEGSLILVSHDRYFISKTANKIWKIVDHEIKEFKGTYQEWVEWNERMAKQKADDGKQKKEDNDKKQEVSSKKLEENISSKNTNSSVPINKELQKIQKQFQKAEEEVSRLNTLKAKLEADLGNPDIYKDVNKFQQTEKEYNNIKQQITLATKNYETLFEKIMELEN